VRPMHARIMAFACPLVTLGYGSCYG
jgi:hypothetical protein